MTTVDGGDHARTRIVRVADKILVWNRIGSVLGEDVHRAITFLLALPRWSTLFPVDTAKAWRFVRGRATAVDSGWQSDAGIHGHGFVEAAVSALATWKLLSSVFAEAATLISSVLRGSCCC